jgi:hypothetical protein
MGFGFCRSIELHELTRFPGEPERDRTAAYSGGSWYFARRDHRWHLVVAEDAMLLRRLPQGASPPKPEYYTQDERCIRAIGGPQGSGDFFDQDPLIER